MSGKQVQSLPVVKRGVTDITVYAATSVQECTSTRLS